MYKRNYEGTGRKGRHPHFLVQKRRFFMIYTGYFAKEKYYPKRLKRYCITRFRPKWLSPDIKTIEGLAPTKNILLDYKEGVLSEAEYIKRYTESILSKIDEEDTAKLAEQLQNSILLCYEKPEDFCHRHIIADWLNRNGYECKEYIL